MRRSQNILRYVLLSILLLCAPIEAPATPFIPEQPTIPASALRAGERGYTLTVLRGTEPTRLPVEVAGVIPQAGPEDASSRGEIRNFILVRLLPAPAGTPLRGPGGHVALARGMSGSPVYFRGKLAGAIGRGWEFSDHSLALVTPIEDMCGVFAQENMEKPKAAGSASLASELLAGAPITVSGVRPVFLERALGGGLMEAPVRRGGLPVEPGRFRPGEAVAALLAWGDVEVAATGTVTATSKDGRFLAFGHSFLKRGRSAYPAARALIHETVSSQAFPFKLASATSLAGTITQDRDSGIGGQSGFFAPSIPVTLVFKDRDRGTLDRRNFRVVADAWLSAKLLDGICAGLVEDVWGRRGQGMMNVTLRVEGRGIRNGWTRNDVFFSGEDAGAVALKPSIQIISALLTQPFEDRMPLSFRLDVEAMEEPRALLIEDVKAPDKVKAGEELKVTVTLRPWRGKPVTRDFTLKAPEGASGICELIVRGGGVHPLPQLAIEGGWKAIDSLDRMLEELGAMDANNELFVELTSDAITDAIKKAAKKDDRDEAHDEANLLPEETEFLSQTKERRIREGTLCVYRSDRFIDGMIKRLVTVQDRAGSDSTRPGGAK